MPNKNLKNKIYVNFLLLVVSFAIFYFFIYALYTGSGTFYNPEKGISELLTDKKDYTAALAVADSYNQKVIKTNSDYAQALNTLPIDKLNNVLPASSDPILAIYELSRIAARPESNLHLTSPRYIDDGDVQGLNKNYNTIAISFSVEGTYGQIKSFLKNLENSEKIFNVTNLDFSSSRDSRPGSALNYTITVETYYLKKQSN
ncbi:hypothetical protein SDC9_33228 [bioreactor metagenome]|uniref:Pilus assembly protein, PilO n=1 Tax=bioreactor metagenome TaxID=1076179 RepID=A0A644V7Q4_9ZZZZ|nr:type 4a pilus biogenesis protein PilO [Candidatus Elulimicrobiales bacterium]